MRSMLVLAIVSLTLHARPAHACSCGLLGGPVSPKDLATEVPTNGVLFFDTFLAPVSAITLATSGGVQLALTMETHGSFLIARPAAAFLAHMRYTVTSTANGQTTTTSFTTGAGPDTAAPSFPGVMAITPEFMQFTPSTNPTGQGCAACDVHFAADDRLSRIHFTLPDPPADTVLLGVQIYIPGDSNLLEELGVTPSGFADRLLGFRGCGPTSPELHDGVTYCARVTAYDAAGNTAGAAAEACATPTACSAQIDMMTCEPLDACLPADGNSGSDSTGGSHSGCTSSPGAGLIVLLLVVPVLRRRRP